MTPREDTLLNEERATKLLRDKEKKETVELILEREATKKTLTGSTSKKSKNPYVKYKSLTSSKTGDKEVYKKDKRRRRRL